MKKFGIIALIVVSGIAGWWWIFSPSHYILAIEPMPEKEELYFLPVSESDHFQLQFIHSVHLSEVVEEYELQKDMLDPVRLIYEDTAIGMPSNAGEGETFEMKNGKYYISDLQGSHSSLDLNIGQVEAEHTINYKGRSHLLKDTIEAGSWVRIEPKRVSYWELWRGVELK
ncbi:DUF1850 domain-containing protein [Salimicrobium halophilum]|uniref:DUF1850 domain-containing protein n=1 Tax=Salimicrobium halophilum TaxID=86666 RepID=A0A1G8TKN1_9BACI|nr:DUF1850 domain-containing protein [Salimicrobium halophilum]SDJ42091.1 protein of unknown function [Salimicrobium halophilum]